MRLLLVAVFFASCLWGWIFGTTTGNFWWKMTVSAALLSGLSLWSNRAELPREYRFIWGHVGRGLLSAALLYFFFWAGGQMMRSVYPASGKEITVVYAAKNQLPASVIGLLLFFVIAPAEEIFWRGLIQKRLVTLTSSSFGIILGALIYALVHAWAGNAILVLAAFCCGLAWGWQYHTSRSLIAPIVSHIVWDLTIFLLLPLG